MKFELNEYHRNVSDKELIEDICKTAKKLNKDTLSRTEYNEHGTYHSSTFEKRFGSWKLSLEKGGLNTKGHNYRFHFSDDDVIKDLSRVANICHSTTLTAKEYSKYGTYHSSTLSNHYGSWNAVLKLAGMSLNLNRNFTNEEMFEEIERLWILLGRQPTSSDIKKGLSIFSLQSYSRRFGGWRSALNAFIEYINSTSRTVQSWDSSLSTNQYKEETLKIESHSQETSRDINLKLRFKVMQRDNFKCCTCGASPAKDPKVVLQIDHILPWSKGGKTTIDNLQTLCSKCNLGKSDSY